MGGGIEQDERHHQDGPAEWPQEPDAGRAAAMERKGRSLPPVQENKIDRMCITKKRPPRFVATAFNIGVIGQMEMQHQS